ncbi:MarR family winged helix-turn-helix transcriptional regulator [Streptomyces sp. 1331.2]|uniref:MarR family winged helix-turn-helix transcriptional regulator n=1 Tax=Streptomyces sp. 1331.2 TaxID=1938835 RepID=UPI000BDA86FD|nr:MarR family transcriptional regulator [Streptomyces sp. 1331.2]SOB88995.1 DNA-binding transcriptional regulator, MarR family [Streptomyces sp. 1331.2]
MPEPQPARTRDHALDDLTRAAYSLSAADSRLRGRATRTPGALSLTHARALRVLVETGPLSIGQLAAATETTGAATTQLVNGLVAAGYVTRERPTGDKRSVLVTLTDAGRRRHHERHAVLTQALDAALAHHDAAGLDIATDVLRQLAAVYDQL